MPSSRLQELARQRVEYTFEPYQRAFEELRKLAPDNAPIPVARTHQAALEACILEELGWLDHSLWPTGTMIFGIDWITPRADESEMSISKACLIEFIKHVMPVIANGEIHGVPGLRPHHAGNQVVLSRPGLPARIRVNVVPSDWHKATAIALEERRQDHDGEPPPPLWILCPNDWHPAETVFVDKLPDKYGVGRHHYRSSGPLSAIFRRIPLLNSGPNIDYWKVWTNGAGHPAHTYDIHMLWANGAPHATVLERLCDPIFGIEASLDPSRSSCRCAPDIHCGIRLNHRGPCRHLYLRRDIEPVRLREEGTSFLRQRYRAELQRRAALCSAHQYVY